MLQPHSYRLIAPDELSMWEDAMAQNVGLDVEPDVARTKTVCACDAIDLDDCDWIGVMVA